MAQPTLLCEENGGRCKTRLGLISENGELVLAGRHHGTWHETRIPIEEVLFRALDAQAISDEMRRKLIGMLEV